MSPDANALLEQGLRVAAHSWFENQPDKFRRYRHVTGWAERAIHVAAVTRHQQLKERLGIQKDYLANAPWLA